MTVEQIKNLAKVMLALRKAKKYRQDSSVYRMRMHGRMNLLLALTFTYMIIE